MLCWKNAKVTPKTPFNIVQSNFKNHVKYCDCSLEIIFPPFTDTQEGKLEVSVNFPGNSVRKSFHVFRGLLLFYASSSV